MGKYPRTRAARLQIAPYDESAGIEPISLGVSKADEPCEYAKKFTVFADMVFTAIEQTNQSLHINRAKILLTDQYFRVRRTLPMYHQDTTNYNNHLCIYQAWVAAYERIERKELEVSPPAFEIPPKPRPRSRQKDVPPPDITDIAVIKKMILGE